MDVVEMVFVLKLRNMMISLDKVYTNYIKEDTIELLLNEPMTFQLCSNDTQK